jgi:transcriptional regulator with XRE-family HTH domain
MDLTEHFGQEVRRARLSLNIAQEQLAAIAGVNRSHMGQIERGLQSASLPTIDRIAKALHCSPAQLLDYTKDDLDNSLQGCS